MSWRFEEVINNNKFVDQDHVCVFEDQDTAGNGVCQMCRKTGPVYFVPLREGK